MTIASNIRRRQATDQDMDQTRAFVDHEDVADILGPDGVEAAKQAARQDRTRRDAKALADAIDNVPPPANADKARRFLGDHPYDTLAVSEARRLGTSIIDPIAEPPDPRLVNRFGAEVCLKHRVLPWRNVSGRVTVLAASADQFLKVRDALTVLFGPVHLAIISSDAMDVALARLCHKTLMHSAEHRTDPKDSCRNWDSGKAFRWGGAIALTILACLLIWPQVSFLVLCGWAVFTLVLNTILKAVSAVLHVLAPAAAAPAPPLAAEDLPVVSLLVPLYRERDIAGALVRRLSQIDYPTDKLDVCLVLEVDDGTTQDAVAAAALPFWMRAIRVPLGTLQTKPRALNYALNFARGSIIGVYDAEDAPDPDQIYKVVQRFAAASPSVACLQGRLDFYNSHSNWLARCFTVEYATWFRIILPGLERLRLAIPLGGTTLFFRREILETIGGWDAHNVTEDADLGIRLTRRGYRTEIIDSTTQEEANARAWPWVKQRSRWLKGYAITYGVHMREPLKLWRDLGPWKFFGVQLLFMGTISQFLLAPLLWSFWLMMVGLPHPLSGVLSQEVALTFAGIFILSEVVNITVSAIAVTSARKRELIIWAPTLHFYFPLAAIAAYKGVIELATKPFYWDKTSHGIFAPTQAPTQKRAKRGAIPPLQPPQHQVAAE
ncbi:glycosyltransferase [Pseudooctadecabacter jejudonensis]|uniref:Beta-monoglucosyldiacylglycerol synthase n=1 Tax=Pseudooctadecabacter jejudonensis TaxID=1391910 RepID=A0A1Y5SHH6_9RHOB|nr:glycosyltransferase [Pseudooctadecabacter jejudonensis]SLN39255.1 Beta-monoglucosyldiacylglycerol synthase [Pseudooctadecabacter jejudonensis]